MDSSIALVHPPITTHQLEKININCERIQFNEKLTDADFNLLSDFMKHRNIKYLRVYEPNTVEDLHFLKYFEHINKFFVDVWNISSLEEIADYCPNLVYLAIGNTKSKAFSLKFIAKLKYLKELYLEGNQKDIDSLVSLDELERLTLRSITLSGLDFLKEINSLWWLAIKLGGTNDISALVDTKLKYLELWRIRGFANILPVSKIRTLQFIFLETLANIDSLPGLSNLFSLRKISLWDLRNLTSIRAILEAPNLEELEILGLNKVETKEFLNLRDHPTLKRASIFVGREKKNAIIHDGLNLPRAGWGKDDFPFIQ